PRAADFTGAVLDGANFRGASLEAASFDNAEIAGSNFMEADLRQARFRSPEPTESYASAWTPYIEHIALALDIKGSVTFRMPNFACADLEGASFERHSLFPGAARIKRVYKSDDPIKQGWHRNLPEFVKEMLESGAEAKFAAAVITPPKFYKANLKNAQFGKRGLFFSLSDHDFLHSVMDAYRYKRIAELQLNQGSMGGKAFEAASTTDKQDLNAFQRELRASFFAAQMEGITLPEEVTAFLKKSVPTQLDYDTVFTGLFSHMADPDLKCTPRLN